MNQVDKEIEEFLRLHPTEPLKKPKPKAQPRVELLKNKLAAPADVVRSTEAFDQTQERFHEQQRRQLASNETLLRNFRLYGRARPLPPEEQRRLSLQFALDAAMERQRREAEHERWLRKQGDPFNLGLY